jgi:regulator of protease activity HflC (stomatin/prohibitin superfamily)
MNIKTLLIVAASAVALAGCGQVVDAGSIGVKVKNVGSNAGVQSEPLPTGWHALGLFGEKIIEYPVTQKVYSFTRASTEGEPLNEEIVFNDNTGLTLSGDVAVTVRINPAKAPAIYAKYRASTDDLIHGTIRNAIRSAVNAEAEKMSSEQIYTGGKAQLIRAALLDVQKQFDKEGIEVLNLEWIGSIRYPASVTAAITLKTTKLQEAEAAKADEARATAQAAAKVAEAKGEAEATRIRGEALRSNPQILQQMWVETWDGKLPTYVGSGETFMMVKP